MLNDFARQRNLIIKSSYFPRKDIHQETRKAPNGNYTNQINNVLIDKKSKSIITNLRTYRRPDPDSDHYLIGLKMKQTHPYNRNSQTKAVERKEEKLNHPRAQTKYLQEMRGKLTNIHEKKAIEDMWQTITLTIKQAVKKPYKQKSK
ncbi:hypothetical protein ILUMI_11553 [Ignelater luminosus]|uniref:Uncharacterized protein n=1 Tax=Ignelater luminosus TaxID=2038154 RepID=A0A8K0CY74_IGNLU|nr:hypothetical protein ILUMI_11553 [Ignelater luminosus]